MKKNMLFFVFALLVAGVNAQVCPHPFKVVVLGSSTSVGTGASSTANSYVGRLRNYLQTSVNAGCIVQNMAVGATTTYNIQPNSFTPPAPFSVDPTKNIDAAIAANPDVIIINFPSNDAANNIPIAAQKANFERVADYAAAHNIPVWISSTQPRNFSSNAQRNALIEMREWIATTFGDYYLDFWTGLAQADGRIEPTYAAPDGIHLNNAGHELLFERVKASSLITEACNLILPITLSNLQLKQSFGNVLLTWDAGQLEPGKFVIQYSNNGTDNWINAGDINAFQNGQAAGTFSFLHTNALSAGSILYYRISAVHATGNITYSDTRKIQLETVAIPYFAHGAGNQIVIRKKTAKNLSFILYDMNGRTIEKNTLTTDQKVISVAARGIYILKINDENGKHWITKVPL